MKDTVQLVRWFNPRVFRLLQVKAKAEKPPKPKGKAEEERERGQVSF